MKRQDLSSVLPSAQEVADFLQALPELDNFTIWQELEYSHHGSSVLPSMLHGFANVSQPTLKTLGVHFGNEQRWISGELFKRLLATHSKMLETVDVYGLCLFADVTWKDIFRYMLDSMTLEEIAMRNLHDIVNDKSAIEFVKRFVLWRCDLEPLLVALPGVRLWVRFDAGAFYPRAAGVRRGLEMVLGGRALA